MCTHLSNNRNVHRSPGIRPHQCTIPDVAIPSTGTRDTQPFLDVPAIAASQLAQTCAGLVGKPTFCIY